MASQSPVQQSLNHARARLPGRDNDEQVGSFSESTLKTSRKTPPTRAPKNPSDTVYHPLDRSNDPNGRILQRSQDSARARHSNTTPTTPHPYASRDPLDGLEVGTFDHLNGEQRGSELIFERSIETPPPNATRYPSDTEIDLFDRSNDSNDLHLERSLTHVRARRSVQYNDQQNRSFSEANVKRLRETSPTCAPRNPPDTFFDPFDRINDPNGRILQRSQANARALRSEQSNTTATTPPPDASRDPLDDLDIDTFDRSNDEQRGSYSEQLFERSIGTPPPYATRYPSDTEFDLINAVNRSNDFDDLHLDRSMTHGRAQHSVHSNDEQDRSFSEANVKILSKTTPTPRNSPDTVDPDDQHLQGSQTNARARRSEHSNTKVITPLLYASRDPSDMEVYNSAEQHPMRSLLEARSQHSDLNDFQKLPRTGDNPSRNHSDTEVGPSGHGYDLAELQRSTSNVGAQNESDLDNTGQKTPTTYRLEIQTCPLGYGDDNDDRQLPEASGGRLYSEN